MTALGAGGAPVALGPDVDTTAPSDTSGGVQLIHQIPSGIACVQDQVWRDAPDDGRFEQMLALRYENDEVAAELAEVNDLVPDTAGISSIYVPRDVPVYFPAMCYAKDGAKSVTLQPSGRPDNDGLFTSPASVAALVVVVVLGVWLLRKLFT